MNWISYISESIKIEDSKKWPKQASFIPFKQKVFFFIIDFYDKSTEQRGLYLG